MKVLPKARLKNMVVQNLKDRIFGICTFVPARQDLSWKFVSKVIRKGEKAMKNNIFRITIFASMLIFSVSLILAQPNIPQPDIGQFFNDLKNRVIANADKLADWKNEAQNAAQKTANDFTSCPSPQAQQFYDDLKNKMAQAKETERLANEADRQAIEARENCKRTTKLNAACDASYNSLSFKATATSARATAEALQKALAALKSLKCASGCNKNAQIVYPTIQKSGEETVTLRELLGPGIPLAYLWIPYPPNSLPDEYLFCTKWRPGYFWADWDAGNGEFSGEFQAKLPTCERWESVGGCKEWDLSSLLPQLQKLKIVPPEITVDDLKVEIPNKSINVVKEVKQVRCTKPIKVPKRASLNLSIELSSNPLEITPQEGQEMVEIGCAEPAFGLQATMGKASFPDPTKARISWKGIRTRTGYVEIDLTKPDFEATCKSRYPTSITLPTFKVTKSSLNLPWACLQPRMVDVIARK